MSQQATVEKITHSEALPAASFEFLFTSSAAKRQRHQQEAVQLLLEKYGDEVSAENFAQKDIHFQQLQSILSEASSIFPLRAVQKEIYHNDSGTAFVPAGLKKLLLNIDSRFVVRPGSLADLQKFVQYANENKLRYTLRGAGTWPFGGAIPLH
ncbi:MAG: FAD-binding oxidoreductase, partial [Calditrichaeota bacterium]